MTLLRHWALFQICVGGLNCLQFVKYHIVQDLDICSLHTGGTGLNHTCAFELAKGVHNDGTGDSHAVSNLAGYQDSLVSIQFLKYMDDCFQFRELQGTVG